MTGKQPVSPISGWLVKAVALAAFGGSWYITTVTGGVPIFGLTIEPWHMAILFLASFLLLEIDARILVVAAVILILACLPASLAGSAGLLEKFSLLAFYLLAGGLALQVIVYVKGIFARKDGGKHGSS